MSSRIRFWMLLRVELKRSMTLTLNQLDKPYYLSYTVDDRTRLVGRRPYLGGLVNASSSDLPSSRELRIRVGDYKFDNTNWMGANAWGTRDTICEVSLSRTHNPLVLRQFLWLATDSAGGV